MTGDDESEVVGDEEFSDGDEDVLSDDDEVEGGEVGGSIPTLKEIGRLAAASITTPSSRHLAELI